MDTGPTSVETFLEGFHEYLMSKNKENSYQPIATSPEKPQKHFDRYYFYVNNLIALKMKLFNHINKLCLLLSQKFY